MLNETFLVIFKHNVCVETVYIFFLSIGFLKVASCGFACVGRSGNGQHGFSGPRNFQIANFRCQQHGAGFAHGHLCHPQFSQFDLHYQRAGPEHKSEVFIFNFALDFEIQVILSFCSPFLTLRFSLKIKLFT